MSYGDNNETARDSRALRNQPIGGEDSVPAGYASAFSEQKERSRTTLITVPHGETSFSQPITERQHGDSTLTAQEERHVGSIVVANDGSMRPEGASDVPQQYAGQDLETLNIMKSADTLSDDVIPTRDGRQRNINVVRTETGIKLAENETDDPDLMRQLEENWRQSNVDTDVVVNEKGELIPRKSIQNKVKPAQQSTENRDPDYIENPTDDWDREKYPALSLVTTDDGSRTSITQYRRSQVAPRIVRLTHEEENNMDIMLPPEEMTNEVIETGRGKQRSVVIHQTDAGIKVVESEVDLAVPEDEELQHAWKSDANDAEDIIIGETGEPALRKSLLEPQERGHFLEQGLDQTDNEMDDWLQERQKNLSLVTTEDGSRTSITQYSRAHKSRQDKTDNVGGELNIALSPDEMANEIIDTGRGKQRSIVIEQTSTGIRVVDSELDLDVPEDEELRRAWRSEAEPTGDLFIDERGEPAIRQSVQIPRTSSGHQSEDTRRLLEDWQHEKQRKLSVVLTEDGSRTSISQYSKRHAAQSDDVVEDNMDIVLSADEMADEVINTGRGKQLSIVIEQTDGGIRVVESEMDFDEPEDEELRRVWASSAEPIGDLIIDETGEPTLRPSIDMNTHKHGDQKTLLDEWQQENKSSPAKIDTANIQDGSVLASNPSNATFSMMDDNLSNYPTDNELWHTDRSIPLPVLNYVSMILDNAQHLLGKPTSEGDSGSRPARRLGGKRPSFPSAFPAGSEKLKPANVKVCFIPQTEDMTSQDLFSLHPTPQVPHPGLFKFVPVSDKPATTDVEEMCKMAEDIFVEHRHNPHSVKSLCNEWLMLSSNRDLEALDYCIKNIAPYLVLALEKLLLEARRRNLIIENQAVENFNPINYLAQYLMRFNRHYKVHKRIPPYLLRMKTVERSLNQEVTKMQNTKPRET